MKDSIYFTQVLVVPKVFSANLEQMNAADAEQKGIKLVSHAKRKLNSSKGCLGIFRSSPAKVRQAIVLYKRAANLFKIAKKWTAAGNAFSEAASLYCETGDEQLGANCYVDASNCYEKCDPHDAVYCLMKAIKIYVDLSWFLTAADGHKSVAEIYETNIVDIENAITHYEQAADYYIVEQLNTSAVICLLCAARLAAHSEQYERAIHIYEELASSCLDNNLLKYGVVEFYFGASLCHLCIGVSNAQLAIKKYEQLFPLFSYSDECNLLKTLMVKIEKVDIDGFSEAIDYYTSTSILEHIPFTHFFKKIKDKIK